MLSGHPDICSEMDHANQEHKMKLQMFGFPSECPVPEGRKCVDPEKKIDISKFKNLLSMAKGKITAHFDITHDTVQMNLKYFCFLFFIIKSDSRCLLFLSGQILFRSKIRNLQNMMEALGIFHSVSYDLTNTIITILFHFSILYLI